MLCSFKAASPPTAGERIGFGQVFWRVFRYGMTLALGIDWLRYDRCFHYSSIRRARLERCSLWANGVRYCIRHSTDFFFQARSEGLAGSVFASFHYLSNSPACCSSGWLPSNGSRFWAPRSPGLGLSLIFPAMAVEALKTVPVANRGVPQLAPTPFFSISLWGQLARLPGWLLGDLATPRRSYSRPLQRLVPRVLSLRLSMAAQLVE